MSSHRIRARPARGEADDRGHVADPERLATFLEDAAHVSGGRIDTLFVPRSEAAIADILRHSRSVLVVGAQSSLTGGATPEGNAVISTARLTDIAFLDDAHVRAQTGVTLTALAAALERRGHWYPPTPTFLGATVGGIVSTNAAGASTFKYGTTRAWVEAMTIVLASGDVLDLVRGKVRAHPDNGFDIETPTGMIRVPVPAYHMPPVPKLSAGYFAEPGMDSIDLFIGSEGTLGIVTEVTLRVLQTRPAECLLFVTFDDRARALACVSDIRNVARATWAGGRHGFDVSGIEHMDARSLALLREDAVDRKTGVNLPEDAAMALLITLLLPPAMTAARAYEEIGRAGDGASDTELTRMCALLARHGVLERTIVAAPGDRHRAQALLDLREAVPIGVNRRVRTAKALNHRVEKTAGDMIVPFDAMASLLDLYDEAFRSRGLDTATWGHISDGNLHPNVIPRGFADVESGRAALLDLGRQILRLGGAPLSEHGVGRNATKQQLLLATYGEAGIADMRRVKAALDPEWKLAPGVIFAR